MTDTIIEATAAGWYADPSSAAAYRWWDGAHWTTATLPDGPADTPGSSAASTETRSPSPTVQSSSGAASATPATATDPLPTRRSLRAQASAGEATAPAALPRADTPLPPSFLAQGAASTDSSPGGFEGHAAQAAATEPGRPEPVAYRPVNPLTAPNSPAVPVSPPGFSVPAAWAANAPTAAQVTDYAVYPGQSSRQPSGVSASYGGSRPEPKNTPARLALTFVLIMMVVSGSIGVARANGGLDNSGVAYLSRLASLAVIGLLVASIPLAIVGLVKASGFVRNGLASKGRAMAIVALVLAVLILAANVVTLAVNLDARPQGQVAGSTSQSPAVTATEPDVGVLQGDGSYVYSQAQAESSIGAAYTTELKAAPTSVVCPASEPMEVSVNFACTVTIQGGTVTTAQATIVDPQGHVEVQVH